MDADVFVCYFLPHRGSWRQPRSSCVPPPTYHPQRPESHEESPSYSWYKNAYFRSFLKTDSPIGCIVTLHWLHDRAFGTLSLRENDLWWCALWKILWIFNDCIGKAFIQCMHWFPLKSFIVELTYRRPFSSVEKLMNLQEGGFGSIFVTNSSMSALLGP